MLLTTNCNRIAFWQTYLSDPASITMECILIFKSVGPKTGPFLIVAGLLFFVFTFFLFTFKLSLRIRRTDMFQKMNRSRNTSFNKLKKY